MISSSKDRMFGMRTRIFRVMVTVLVAGSLSSCSTQPAKQTSPAEQFFIADSMPAPINALNAQFRAHYQAALATHQQHLRATYPIITQDLLNMTLLRAHGGPENFSMNRGAYMLMAHSAHPSLTVYSLLAVNGFGSLTESTQAKLTEYSLVLEGALTQVRAMGLPAATHQRLETILSSTQAFVGDILRTKRVTRGDYAAYLRPLRPLIRENLRVGAAEQLLQFKAKMNAWRAAYPDEQWGQLRVVVMGFHQPREEYALKLFFQWLLREPEYEDRVVYAEFQELPRGEAMAKAKEQALKLLSQVDFEQEAAGLMFDEHTLLQKDVMGPAAADLLETWGNSDWPRQ